MYEAVGYEANDTVTKKSNEDIKSGSKRELKRPMVQGRGAESHDFQLPVPQKTTSKQSWNKSVI